MDGDKLKWQFFGAKISKCGLIAGGIGFWSCADGDTRKSFLNNYG